MTAALIKYGTQTYMYAYIWCPAVYLASPGNITCSLRISTHTAQRPIAAQRRLIRQSCQRSVTIPLATPQEKKKKSERVGKKRRKSRENQTDGQVEREEDSRSTTDRQTDTG